MKIGLLFAPIETPVFEAPTVRSWERSVPIRVKTYDGFVDTTKIEHTSYESLTEDQAAIGGWHEVTLTLPVPIIERPLGIPSDAAFLRLTDDPVGSGAKHLYGWLVCVTTSESDEWLTSHDGYAGDPVATVQTSGDEIVVVNHEARDRILEKDDGDATQSLDLVLPVRTDLPVGHPKRQLRLLKKVFSGMTATRQET